MSTVQNFVLNYLQCFKTCKFFSISDAVDFLWLSTKSKYPWHRKANKFSLYTAIWRKFKEDFIKEMKLILNIN